MKDIAVENASRRLFDDSSATSSAISTKEPGSSRMRIELTSVRAGDHTAAPPNVARASDIALRLNSAWAELDYRRDFEAHSKEIATQLKPRKELDIAPVLVRRRNSRYRVPTPDRLPDTADYTDYPCDKREKPEENRKLMPAGLPEYTSEELADMLSATRGR